MAMVVLPSLGPEEVTTKVRDSRPWVEYEIAVLTHRNASEIVDFGWL